MRAVTWHGRADVRVDTVPDPVIQEPTDVIVEVTSSGAFSAGAPPGVRVFPWAGTGIRRLPFVGFGSSARGRSWWSELMHLTSVGGHSTARSRGEERCPCKHAVTNS